MYVLVLKNVRNTLISHVNHVKGYKRLDLEKKRNVLGLKLRNEGKDVLKV